jgi:hypothetical protein
MLKMLATDRSAKAFALQLEERDGFSRAINSTTR